MLGILKNRIRKCRSLVATAGARLSVVLMLAVFGTATLRAEPEWKFFRGMCDASALEMLNDDLFVAANDEDNVLRVFSRSQPGFAVQTLDFSSYYRLAK